MILFEIFGTENNKIYRDLEISNGNRHYDFLRSVVVASLESGKVFLSQQVIKALNYHAIACLHTNPGEYRPCAVTVGKYEPPAHYRVQALMDDFVNFVNRTWQDTDEVTLATFVLWRLNNIHPFINGNGRTARAASYFVLCLRTGGWLPGNIILPELLRQHRDEYVAALQAADTSLVAGKLDLTPLHTLVSQLLDKQLKPQSAANIPSTGAKPDGQAQPTPP